MLFRSGINRADAAQREGLYPPPKGSSEIMGLECAGEIAALGDGVTGFKVGDRVCALLAGGGYATYCAVPAVQALPLPKGFSFEQGAAIPVGWLTAWHALVTVANAQPGQRVLIEAIASSVGSAALQIARSRGAWVSGTASRDDKCDRARAAGADAAWNYKTSDVAAAVMQATAGHGIDIGLMTIGEETAASLFDSMAAEGHIVMYGSTGGRQVCFSLNIGTRNLRLSAMSISSSARFLPETMQTFRDVAVPAFAAGRYTAVVDTVLPMAELARAHAMVDARTHFGKVILVN